MSAWGYVLLVLVGFPTACFLAYAVGYIGTLIFYKIKTEIAAWKAGER